MEDYIVQILGVALATLIVWGGLTARTYMIEKINKAKLDAAYTNNEIKQQEWEMKEKVIQLVTHYIDQISLVDDIRGSAKLNAAVSYIQKQPGVNFLFDNEEEIIAFIEARLRELDLEKQKTTTAINAILVDSTPTNQETKG